MEIEWEDPPADALGPSGRAGTYAAFAAALQQHPDRWAKAPGERTESSAKAFAQNVRRGKVKGFAVNAYQTAVKGTDVWIRYVAPPDDVRVEPDPELDAQRAEDTKEEGYGPKVRAWARDNGYTVTDRGRLPEDILAAYRKATAPRPRIVRES